VAVDGDRHVHQPGFLEPANHSRVATGDVPRLRRVQVALAAEGPVPLHFVHRLGPRPAA